MHHPVHNYSKFGSVMLSFMQRGFNIILHHYDCVPRRKDSTFAAFCNVSIVCDQKLALLARERKSYLYVVIENNGLHVTPDRWNRDLQRKEMKIDQSDYFFYFHSCQNT